MLNQLKNEKRNLHLQQNKNSKKQEKKEKKERKKKIEKTREKAIKGLIDFNKFIRGDIIEPGQRRSFDFKARNVKQEIIDSYRR